MSLPVKYHAIMLVRALCIESFGISVNLEKHHKNHIFVIVKSNGYTESVLFRFYNDMLYHSRIGKMMRRDLSPNTGGNSHRCLSLSRVYSW